MISYRLIKRVSQLTVVVIIRHKFGSCSDVPCPSAVTASVGCAHYPVVALPWPPENNHPLGLTHSKLMATSRSAHRYRHVTYAQLYRTPLRVAAGGVCGIFVYCRWRCVAIVLIWRYYSSAGLSYHQLLIWRPALIDDLIRWHRPWWRHDCCRLTACAEQYGIHQMSAVVVGWWRAEHEHDCCCYTNLATLLLICSTFI